MITAHRGRRAPRRSVLRPAAALLVAVAFGSVAMVDVTSGQSLSPATVTVSDFTPVVLSGNPATTTATMGDYSVTDTAGLGWHLTVQATAFAEVDGAGAYVPGGKTLPVGSLAMPAPTVTPTNALISVAVGPHLIDGATVKIVTATAGTSGTFDFAQSGPLSLSIPSSAYARSYRSDLTVSVHAGP